MRALASIPNAMIARKKKKGKGKGRQRGRWRERGKEKEKRQERKKQVGVCKVPPTAVGRGHYC